MAKSKERFISARRKKEPPAHEAHVPQHELDRVVAAHRSVLEEIQEDHAEAMDQLQRENRRLFEALEETREALNRGTPNIAAALALLNEELDD